MNYLGDFAVGAKVYVPFHTFDSNGASITITGLAVTDIEVYKDGLATQRASDAGYALLDTDGIDFDGLTGIHGFSIDLADNTDAGFYASGHDYWVVVSSITCDTRTISFVAATFSIENRSASLRLGAPAGASVSADILNVADAVWDEVLTGATHNVASSAGRRLRQLASSIIFDGTVATVGTNYITFAGGASATQNAYRGDMVVVMSGVGLGQTRTIVEYTGASVKAYVDKPWDVAPGIGDEVMVLAAAQELVAAFGTVVSATGTGVRFAADASSTNNMYRYSIVVVTSVAGVNDTQARLITSYDGATQTATVFPAWTATPAAGATYKVMPLGLATIDEVSVNALVAAMIAGVADGAYDLQEMMRIIFAFASGKADGGGTATVHFRDSADSKNRITETVDASGNRTAVVLDAS